MSKSSIGTARLIHKPMRGVGRVGRAEFRRALGEHLRAMRVAKGITQVRLARASGVFSGAVSDYESGRRSPSLLAALLLAEVLGAELLSLRMFKLYM